MAVEHPTTEYRLVSIAPTAHKLEDGQDCHGYRCGQCKSRASVKLPVAGSALIVPPPPDYSSVAAVSKRCYEAGTRSDADLRAATNDTIVRKTYRELRKVVPALPCRVEDTHQSKWEIHRNHIPDLVAREGLYILIPRQESTVQVIPRPRKRGRRKHMQEVA